MVTLSWNSIFNAPRILEGAISERNTGTACHQIENKNHECDTIKILLSQRNVMITNVNLLLVKELFFISIIYN